ncbi:MAG: hypothetical protein IKG85_06890 [Clostridia bacterium]|nr:hypothetical protein [Clostridia bacterium]
MKIKGFLSILLAALMLLCGCGVKDAAPAPTAEPTNTPDPTQQAAAPVIGDYLLAAPVSHEYAADPNTIVTESGDADMEKFGELAEAWRAQQQERDTAARSVPDMRGFTEALFGELTKEAGNGNVIFSPANVYMALALLAESTEGETRAEILNALGAGSMDELRASAAALMKAEPIDDGITKCGIANSLWLNNGTAFNTDTLERIAEIYEGSSYWGDPADAGFTEALREWLNANTGGMLKDSVAQVSLPVDLVAAIASAIYFKAAWEYDYSKDHTDVMPFHTPEGDIDADFMHKDSVGRYYEGEGFRAYCEPLKNGAGAMWFLLPDEGVSVEEMMKTHGMEFIRSDKSEAMSANVIVHVSMPKIDVKSDIDLAGALSGMGIRSCFDPARADFSPLLAEDAPVCINAAKHVARVKTDEDGVEAAAFTIFYAGAAAPVERREVDFVLDRPFAFFITGQSVAPLFMGVVNTPND